MFTVEQVDNIVGRNALIAGVDTVPKGHIRIETGFLYPDGSSIDIFLQQEDGLPGVTNPRLTDFGNTYSWLQNLEMRPNRSATQKLYFDRIMELYHCHFQGAAIQHDMQSIDQLPDGIVKIGQACLRTADLVYSKRFRLQSSFNQNVEDVLSETTLDFEPGAEIPVSEGKIVRVDFKVRGVRMDTAVQTLSSGNTQYAHQKAVEINARWDDIRELGTWADRGQCLTIFDDSSNHYDTQDLDRLRRKSILLPFSETEEIGNILRAA